MLEIIGRYNVSAWKEILSCDPEQWSKMVEEKKNQEPKVQAEIRNMLDVN